MEILEYGNPSNNKLILIHGFQMHTDSLKPYIDSFKDDYCVIVPILPSHNSNINEEFISFDKCLIEFEDYYVSRYENEVFAVIAFSMGGVFASLIWEHKKISINKLIMESSPLLKWNNFIISMMIKQYLFLTKATRNRDPKILRQATQSIVLEQNLDLFLSLMDNMSDETIIRYIQEVGKYSLPNNIDTPNTEIYYSYGSKINEIVFRSVAKYIRKYYSNSHITCNKNKGHCEDAILQPEEKVKELIKILKQ